MTNDPDTYWSELYRSGRDFRLATSQAISTFLSYTNPKASKTALDIGCGTGQLSRELAHRGYTVHGVDASQVAVETSQSLTDSERLRYEQMDVEKGLEFEGTFGLIACKLVYAFIDDKPTFLARVKDVLEANGTFVIATPLLDNVPPEKVSIAVDLEPILTELSTVFPHVELYDFEGLEYFICKR